MTGLTRRFSRAGAAAVDGLSFTATPGQTVCLLGPNGCGKSTTLRMLAGALAATSGTFTVDGRRGGVDATTVQAKTGYVPDVGGLFPRLTGREHLDLTARLFGLDRRAADRRGQYLLHQLDLTDAADARAGTYSHGMSRKLSAAIALLPGPQLLLADEPFDGVDAAGVDRLTEFFAAHTATGGILVLSTHLLDAAAALATRVHLLRRGQCVATLTAPTPEQLRTNWTSHLTTVSPVARPSSRSENRPQSEC